MRVCVIGCGAIGSLFAAHLARLDDTEVWAYDVNQPHIDAINAKGLRLSGVSELVSHPRATTDAKQIPPCEFGVIATKTMYTRSAMQAIAHVFADGAVCSVQNGVGAEEIVAEYVPRVIRGTTFPAGHIVEPGHVAQDTGGKTTIGPFEPKPASMDEVSQLADVMTRSGMQTVAQEDARGAQWTKVIFNAATNPLGALTHLPHGAACDQPKLRQLISGLAAEGVAVSKALGITLEMDPEKLIDHAREVAYNHKASMLQDVLARRRTEIDAINGGIVQFGRQMGIATPLNEAIYALITALEFSWTLDDAH